MAAVPSIEWAPQTVQQQPETSPGTQLQVNAQANRTLATHPYGPYHDDQLDKIILYDVRYIPVRDAFRNRERFSTAPLTHLPSYGRAPLFFRVEPSGGLV